MEPKMKTPWESPRVQILSVAYRLVTEDTPSGERIPSDAYRAGTEGKTGETPA